EANVAAQTEHYAIRIDRSKEVVDLLPVLPGLGGVDGNPSDSSDVKLRPAMVTGDLRVSGGGRQRKTYFESRRNAGGAGHADEEGMEVGAIAMLGCAGVDGVAVPPTRALMVVMHGSDHVVVDLARLF